MKTLRFLTFFLLVFFCPFFCFAQSYNEQLIRVAVAKNIDDCIISARGIYKIINPKTGDVLSEGRQLRNSRILFHEGKIHIGKNSYNLTHLRISTSKDISVAVAKNTRWYRDNMDIIVGKDNKLLLLNIVDLESYIRGVLYHEVSNRWPMEATKAQAVAARSYALYQIHKNKKNLFDVTSDIYSQVYGGRSAERYRTNLAVAKTSGEIITYQGKVLPAYYHSNSGGRTEDASELWDHDLPPLKGIEDPYAKGSPNYEWRKNFQSKVVQEKLNSEGYSLGLIKDIKIVERTKSGRVKKISILTRDGQEVSISGKHFREILGPNIIKSSLFEIVMHGYFFDVIGHGWGHGVGMCQWGANNMAEQRFKYDEILQFYYPGSNIVKLE